VNRIRANPIHEETSVPTALVRFLSVLIIATSCLIFNRAATAGLLVSVGNTVIQEGGTGYVDVTIESDAPLGDPLAMFGFEFRIETAGATRLDFVTSQSDWQLTSSDYVFAGDSLADLFPPVGTVATTIVPDDTYVGGDGTESGDELLVGSLNRLLVRLEVTAQTALPPVLGDTFTIRLVDGPNTFFLDSAFNDVAYQSTFGTVQVVPEPATWVLAALGTLIILPRLSRRAADFTDKRADHA